MIALASRLKLKAPLLDIERNIPIYDGSLVHVTDVLSQPSGKVMYDVAEVVDTVYVALSFRVAK